MPPTPYNRHSIRLKSHDYSGGGTYFVTLCAHHDAGPIFAPPPVKAMLACEWENVGAGLVPALPYVIMPDHFHALLRLPPNEKSLGDIVGAFKSRVVHAYISGVKNAGWSPFPGKIWQRNYYERIVRDAEAEATIAHYIRLNPWRCVTEFGAGLRGMGNPALWNLPKTEVLASRNGRVGVGAGLVPALTETPVIMGGFHSPIERAIFDRLLDERRPVIWCPAWGIREAVRAGLVPALEENRLLILEMTAHDGTLASAEARNRFILEHADRIWLPHVTPGGMLDCLIRENPGFQTKIIQQGYSP